MEYRNLKVQSSRSDATSFVAAKRSFAYLVSFEEDTIVAIATPIGLSAIGVIRVSGKKTFSIIKSIFVSETFFGKISPRKMYVGSLVNPENQNILIDIGMICYMKTDKSYTGEDLCEIFTHGNPLILQKLMDIIVSCGARVAHPGEFTQRAFLNNKIDLSQAEAVMDVVMSTSEFALRNALKHLKGDLKEKINNIRTRILNMMAQIEVTIEYSEEVINEIDKNTLIEILNKIMGETTSLINSFQIGKNLHFGLKIPIVGSPNVGKSSLLNNILGYDRAIVSRIPGTTRDTIEERISIFDYPVLLVDTAGIVETIDEVEQAGIERTKRYIKNADIILFILDASQPLSSADKEIFRLISKKNFFTVINKIDLPIKLSIDNVKEMTKQEVIFSSTVSVDGIKDLVEILREYISNNCKISDEILISNTRHKILLEQTKQNISNAIESINSFPIDIISIDLRNAVHCLDKITGNDVTEDLLQNIFSNFCVGK